MTADVGTAPMTGFTVPPGWIHRLPADDLDLAVLLVNSMDLLEDPPDRLTSVEWYRDALRAAGHEYVAAGLAEKDLDGLRELRALLRLVFSADSVEEAVEIVNPMLVHGAAVPQLVLDEEGRPALRVAPDATGLAALQARLPAAAAGLIAETALRRLGTCAGVPCECAFVDRSRSGSRRFCSDWCNDRAAAAAYRARRKAGR
jgi:predicted RNA-binding Zn ribbon-like protein